MKEASETLVFRAVRQAVMVLSSLAAHLYIPLFLAEIPSLLCQALTKPECLASGSLKQSYLFELSEVFAYCHAQVLG
jgi:hypothetical protein